VSIVVELCENEMLAAIIVASKRKLASDLRRASGGESRGRERFAGDIHWDNEIESAFAEVAVARWRNRYWSGAQSIPHVVGTDAGAAQVRWTRHPDGHLLVYTADADGDNFVLVTGLGPTMTIVGWIPGIDTRSPEYWREDAKCPCWWVPQRDLRAINQ
jgi:hypothetical protein